MKKYISNLLKSIIVSAIEIIILVAIVAAILNYCEKCRNFLNFGTILLDGEEMEVFGPYNIEIISQSNRITVNVLNVEENTENTFTKTHIETIAIFLVLLYSLMLIIDSVLWSIDYLINRKNEKIIKDLHIEEEGIRIPHYNPLIIYQLNEFSMAHIKENYLINVMFKYMIAKGYVSENEEYYILQNTNLETLSKSELKFIKLFFENEIYIKKQEKTLLEQEISMQTVLESVKEEMIDLDFIQQAKYKELIEKLKVNRFHQKVLKVLKMTNEEIENVLFFYSVCISMIVVIMIPFLRMLLEAIEIFNTLSFLFGMFLVFKLISLFRPVTTSKGKLEKIKHKFLTKKLNEQEVLTKLEESYYMILKNID